MLIQEVLFNFGCGSVCLKMSDPLPFEGAHRAANYVIHLDRWRLVSQPRWLALALAVIPNRHFVFVISAPASHWKLPHT